MEVKVNKAKEERIKRFENSLLEKHNVNQTIARNLLTSKPAYNLGIKNQDIDNKSNAGVFDHTQLIKQTQAGDAKDKLFSKNIENESRRDITSEIDYSDHKSIAALVKVQK